MFLGLFFPKGPAIPEISIDRKKLKVLLRYLFYECFVDVVTQDKGKKARECVATCKNNSGKE